MSSSEGDSEGYLIYLQNKQIEPMVQAYEFGSNVRIAVRELVLDRRERKLYAGTR